MSKLILRAIVGLIAIIFPCDNLKTQSIDSLVHSLADKAQEFNNQKSIPYLEEAFNICNNYGCADSTIARLYQRKSVATYFSGDNYQLALRYTDTAIYYYELEFGNKHIITANSYFNKGAIQAHLGMVYNAKKSVDSAIKILELIDRKDLPSKDSILLNWQFESMKISTNIGDDETALMLGRRILLSDFIFPYVEDGVILTTAGIHLKQANYETAKELYTDYINKKNGIVDVLLIGDLGLANLALSEYEVAERRLLVRHDFELTNVSDNNSYHNRRRLAISHTNLLELYLQTKNWKKAEYHSNEAFRLLLEVDSTGSLPRFSEIYFKKAKLEYSLGRYESAIELLDRAIEVVAPELTSNDQNNRITVIGRFNEVLEIIGFRANVLASQGQTAAALEDVMLLNRLVTQSRRTYQSSLSKYYLIQQVVPVYELGIRLNRQLYEQTGEGRYLEQAYALNARNKAILLLESLQSDRAMTFAGLPPALQEEEKTLRDALIEQERLLYLAYQNDQEIDSLQAVVFDHEQAYYRFVQQLEKNYPAYYDLKYSADQPPAVSAVQNQLEGDQALLEYFMGQDSIYTFLMDGRDMKVFSKPKPAGFVDSVELFRELLTNGIEKDCETTYIRLGRYFYDLLLAAPLAQLEDSKNRLVIIPDGLLNFLSFEALLYKDVDRLRGADGFLIERYAFSYAYSSKLLLEQAYYPRSASKGFVGFGMEYDDHTLNYLHELDYGDWKYIDSTFTLPCGQLKDTTRYYGKLTYSDDEVRGIAELAQGDSWLNESVTKRNFLQHAGDYNLLHLAMHGTYDLDFPMNSSLIFTRTDSSDVFLRAAEIYGMELTGDMVVLSACNTAYGKLQPGEGPMTLARAFHYAGIPSVVASLWSIPDNSTSRIMKLFYEQLDKGLPKDQALQQAKLAYLASDDISSPNTRQPLHWAPTIVIGDINPVEVSPGNSWYWVFGGVTLLALLLIVARRRA